MRVASAVPLTTEDKSNAPSRMHLIDKTAPAIEAMSKAFEDLHRSAGLRRRREGSRDHCHHCGNRANIIPNETPLAPWKRVDDIQASLPAKDRARVEREGNLISRAEYEKYLSDVASREN